LAVRAVLGLGQHLDLSDEGKRFLVGLIPNILGELEQMMDNCGFDDALREHTRATWANRHRRQLESTQTSRFAQRKKFQTERFELIKHLVERKSLYDKHCHLCPRRCQLGVKYRCNGCFSCRLPAFFCKKHGELHASTTIGHQIMDCNGNFFEKGVIQLQVSVNTY
jgi:hypothetical protein